MKAKVVIGFEKNTTIKEMHTFFEELEKIVQKSKVKWCVNNFTTKFER